jgi:hypothetical protein
MLVFGLRCSIFVSRNDVIVFCRFPNRTKLSIFSKKVWSDCRVSTCIVFGRMFDLAWLRISSFPCNAVLRVFSCTSLSFPTSQRPTHQKQKSNVSKTRRYWHARTISWVGRMNLQALRPLAALEICFSHPTPKAGSPQFFWKTPSIEPHPKPLSKQAEKRIVNNTFESFVGRGTWFSKPWA